MLLFAATERQRTVHLERPIVAVDNSAVDYQSCMALTQKKSGTDYLCVFFVCFF